MYKNKLMIAAAGSGKTTYLIEQSLKIKEKNVLITTYTEANEEEIRKKFIEKVGHIPRNITIQTWFSFLLHHGVRPYQSAMDDRLQELRIGFYLTDQPSGLRYNNKKNGFPVYWGKLDLFPYYFTKSLKIYSDKIAEFIVECNKKTDKEVIGRISRIYPYIFIDEVQDLAGWELEILKLLFGSKSKVLLVGDPRQVTYLTHHPKKYVKYADGKIDEFIRNECVNNICEIDTKTLSKTHRNNKHICDFSSKLFQEYRPCTPCNCENCRSYAETHEGIFFVRKQDIEKYCQEYSPTILKEKLAAYPDWNYGKSKGLTFNRVLIYPTNSIKNWIRDHSTELAATTRCKFYVAITRARHSVGIVFDYHETEEFIGVNKYNPNCFDVLGI